jgi:hypothetical protein
MARFGASQYDMTHNGTLYHALPAVSSQRSGFFTSSAQRPHHFIARSLLILANKSA